jgi:uncharacterized protein YbjT (DUF2867 family)
MPALLTRPENRLAYAASAMRAAAEGGVRLVVWNASGRLPESHEDPTSGRAVQMLWETLRSSGVPLTVVAPTKYMENLLGPWTAPRVGISNRQCYPNAPERKVGWIASADVCAFMVECLERPHLAGSVFRVSGPERLTGDELAQSFSAALGRSITYEQLSLSQMERAVDDLYGIGAGSGVWQEYGRLQKPDAPALFYDMDPVLRQLPVKMTDVRQFVSAHRTAFSSRVTD